ncbi:MAG: SBBP repeat-containing protein [candidate division WOR-3 bacterium]|nr:SBBP repeat-containing protein [candidate division WOR-3 bacterium]
MNSIKRTFFFFLVFVKLLWAQPDTIWTRRYDELINSKDGATAIAIDNWGNVYVTGWTGSGRLMDYLTIKINPSGETLWTRRYNGTANDRDYPYAIAVDALGNVYVTGESFSAHTDFDCVTIKYNAQGLEQWIARYDGPIGGGDFAYALTLDNIGNVYIAGESDGGNSFYDYFVVKYNTNGVEQWSQRYDGPDNEADCANAIAVDALGNVYVTGESQGVEGDFDFATIKYNAQGILQWIQRYDGLAEGDDKAYSIKVDGAGNVYVTGESFGFGTYFDFATIKYNTNGVEQWVRRYDGPDNDDDCANALAVDNYGNVYVTGESFSYTTNYDYVTIKYNSTGTQLWLQRYNGTGNGIDFPKAIFVDVSNNVYVTGTSWSTGTAYDYTTIKYNALGVQQWTQRYNGTGNGGDDASSIVVDNSGSVYVTGTSLGVGSYEDFITLKYNTNGTQQWVSQCNGQTHSYDEATRLVIDNANNLYITGASEGSGTYFDYATIKYNSNGERLWVSRYNGSGNANDYPYAMTVDGWGNVYVTGESYGLGTDYDIVTVKYNAQGIQQWSQRYNGSANRYDAGSDICVDMLGNVYVTGVCENLSTDFDYVTIKYNSNGEVQWIKTYNGPSNIIDYANAITVDNEGNVYVTGASFGSGTFYDYATIKYNPYGETLWVRRYNGPGNYSDGAFAIAVDNQGNVYVTGRSWGSGTNRDIATIKYNRDGTQEWVQRYNGLINGEDGAYALAVDLQGNVYVSGYSYSISTNKDFATTKYRVDSFEQWPQEQNRLSSISTNKDFVTIKYSAEGTQQWVQRYDGYGYDDEACDIKVDYFSNAYVTGTSYNPTSNFDYVTIKYSSDGNQLWLHRFNDAGNLDDKAVSLALDAMNNIYITGKSYGLGTSYDYFTIKYTQTSALEQTRTLFDIQDVNLKACPNPFRERTAITYSLFQTENVSLTIYDIAGQLVKTLVKGKQPLGNYQFYWNGTDEKNQKVSAGIYFYLWQTEKDIKCKKILMLK